ncbi:DUF6531 domain-containing protein, partial [Pseudomonas indica]|uniref:DUF6531 domain-containing protein n=1 Tax=Pseudomonas indica TaxID=137658 RepID=UPI001140B02D
MIDTKGALFILLSMHLFLSIPTAKGEYIEYMSDDSVSHYDHFPSEDEARARCYSFVIGLGYNNPAHYCLPYGGPAWAAGWLRETNSKIFHFGIFYFDKCSAPSFFNPTTGECGADGKGSLPPALACPSPMQANPVNASNGNKFQRETDFQSTSNPDMKFARSFNSKDGVWRHNFSTQLYIRADYLALISDDGHASFFPRSEGSTSFYKGGVGGIEQNPNGWTYTDTQNNSFFFDAEGTLIGLKKKTGSELFLVKNGGSTTVADTSGNSFSFTSDAAQQPLSLTADAVNISYSYNWYKHLTQVTKKWGSQTSIRKFHYEDSRNNRLLTGISDERGIRYATWRYDSNGRAISSEHANGAEKVTLSYNADGSTTVTNELGKQTV